MSKKVKIYLSDEGFGHIVRQNAIHSELKKMIPDLQTTIQTEKHLEVAKNIFGKAEYISKHGNIIWIKKKNGSPDINKIQSFYEDYESRWDAYLLSEENKLNHDFVLSDFVYEPFDIASKKNIPIFGIAHFTWDWFFSKLYPSPLKSSLIKRFSDSANKADVLYFPPLTPLEIIQHYKNSKMVPFIVRKNINHKKVEPFKNRFKVLIIDSGAGVLKNSILKSFSQLSELRDIQFYLVEGYNQYADNITYIPSQELLVDYIGDVDLVIGRAGFNTISECIAIRTPMLLLGEAMNPEMSENIIELKKLGLGSFISLVEFETSLTTYLPRFISSEYKIIKENMDNHELPTNGAEVIAEDITNRIS